MTEFGNQKTAGNGAVGEPNPLRTHEGRARGMERYQQGQQGRYTPSVFFCKPGRGSFTMSPITLMRRFTEDIDRAFG